MAAMYRCVYLNRNTAHLTLQGHWHVTTCFPTHTHTANKTYTEKNIFQASCTQVNQYNKKEPESSSAEMQVGAVAAFSPVPMQEPPFPQDTQEPGQEG